MNKETFLCRQIEELTSESEQQERDEKKTFSSLQKEQKNAKSKSKASCPQESTPERDVKRGREQSESETIDKLYNLSHFYAPTA